MVSRFALVGLVLAAGLGLSACTDGYGYSGVEVGYGPGYYSSGYYDDGYGYADYGNSYYGWYGDYYYPGSGIYVYDRYRRPYRWNGDQQRYWQSRRGEAYRGGGDRREDRGNWRDFSQDRRQDNRGFAQDRRQDRQTLNSGQVTTNQYRTERSDARQSYRQNGRTSGQGGWRGRRH